MTKIYNTGGLSKRPEKLNGLVKMIENQEDLLPEFQRVVDKMFNEIIEEHSFPEEHSWSEK